MAESNGQLRQPRPVVPSRCSADARAADSLGRQPATTSKVRSRTGDPDLTKPEMDSSFTTDVARFYESNLVPLIFRPYARDLAERTKEVRPSAVLEVACGTGVVTRALVEAVPTDCSIFATDLNEAMVAHGQRVGTTPADDPEPGSPCGVPASVRGTGSTRSGRSTRLDPTGSRPSATRGCSRPASQPPLSPSIIEALRAPWHQEDVWHILGPDGAPTARIRLPSVTRLLPVPTAHVA